ncbi:hypothetical protein IT774_04505 [Salinimonas marina]|uniref:Peptidase A2 domain-containing protein n=1 Tax=Salinimonas marina TaxID=2785918 RepID=A0A7S9HEA2_9ALTE|nr:aspartyl protease family protein [Salinimonas marina]QPG06451.1 hypothetical protein IT774_04505 [Salinimonas marina]
MLSRLLCCVLLILSAWSAQATVTPWLEFKLQDGHISLPVTVSGHPTYAILDSGAQMNAINKKFIDKHELNYTGVGTTYINGPFGKKGIKNYPISRWECLVQLQE